MAYIEREKVLEIAKDEYYSDFHRSMADLTSLRELLEDTPIADVVEVRHGHWERGCSDGDIYAYCTACKRRMNYHCYGYAYCSLCGAKMDGKDGEG